MPHPDPTLAAVVVTHDRLDHLRITLDRLLAQRVRHVVVVDNASTDGTADWLARQQDPRLILHSFLLRALAQAGWAPTFDRCARCGAPGPHTALHVGLGGAVCPECRPPGAAHPAPETFDLLSALAAGDWATADASGAPARREAAGIVAAYLQFHAERRLVSLSVLDQDLGLPAPRVERRP